ncbi:unnamed protein product [Anisakis simplex]|uniref:tRNA-guanosine(34) queuine transglycosylase n=1 Tax=Anisakis simplex TaxID=6269 RepID=A0A3P6QGM1_ANISI|nr:unnamed protein product [Anisakis simplex]
MKGEVAMNFRIIAQANRARRGELKLPHSVVETPVFMPVGTQGTMKGILPEQLIDMDCRILLCNTYHLGHRPGHELVRKAGGLHKMINWPRSILTDSGGFQMVSLNKLMSIDETGVQFVSPHTNQLTHLTPEHCIEIQENLGADIIMQLDHVVHVLTDGPVVEEAMQRSIRLSWLDRCLAAHKRRSDQLLFPIVQGGLNLKLRSDCAEEMSKRCTIGIAIGGLSGGEEKRSFWKVVAHCCERLPQQIPRYVMGVGWAVDLVICALLGADMFDCVYPTRTARFGSALRLKLQEEIGCHLISLHNIKHQLDLMKRIREAISNDRVQEFLNEFLHEQYPDGDIPEWIRNAAAYMNYQIII